MKFKNEVKQSQEVKRGTNCEKLYESFKNIVRNYDEEIIDEGHKITTIGDDEIGFSLEYIKDGVAPGVDKLVQHNIYKGEKRSTSADSLNELMINANYIKQYIENKKWNADNQKRDISAFKAK